MARKNNIVKFRHGFSLNIGFIIFFVIIIYVIFHIFTYITSKPVSEYEVRQGTIATNNVYKGLILRSETIIYAQQDGYINYFRGDVTIREFSITSGNITYVNPVNVFQPAANTEYENNIPITWYCRIMVRSDLASKFQSFSTFVMNTAKAEIENRIKEMIGGV